MSRKSGSIRLLIFAFIISAAPFSAASVFQRSKPDENTRRDISSGPLIGKKTQKGNFFWEGIPYAKPPVGHLRWKSPQAVEPWQKEYKAIQAKPYCPQYTGLTIGKYILEVKLQKVDCWN